MYENVRSKVKLDGNLSAPCRCYLGVRQGKYLSPFLFSMYLNDLKDDFYLKGAKGEDVYMLILFILLYADDVILFANSPEEMQNSLNILSN